MNAKEPVIQSQYQAVNRLLSPVTPMQLAATAILSLGLASAAASGEPNMVTQLPLFALGFALPLFVFTYFASAIFNWLDSADYDREKLEEGEVDETELDLSLPSLATIFFAVAAVGILNRPDRGAFYILGAIGGAAVFTTVVNLVVRSRRKKAVKTGD